MNEFAKRFLLDALQEATELHIELQDVSLDEYVNSRQYRYTTERGLTIIGEAIRRALDKEPTLASSSAGLREWVNLRNIITHQYDGLSEEKTWYAARTETESLIDLLDQLLPD